MRRTRALKNAGGLMAAVSLDILAFRSFAAVDPPERWSKLLARQADAYGHGEGMCIYDPLSFLHHPSIHAFMVGPVMAYSTIALLVVGFAVSALAVRMEGRRNQQQLTDAEGAEVNG